MHFTFKKDINPFKLKSNGMWIATFLTIVHCGVQTKLNHFFSIQSNAATIELDYKVIIQIHVHVKCCFVSH